MIQEKIAAYVDGRVEAVNALTPKQKADLLAAKKAASGDWRKERELLKKSYTDAEIDKMLNDWDGKF